MMRKGSSVVRYDPDGDETPIGDPPDDDGFGGDEEDEEDEEDDDDEEPLQAVAS